MAKRGRKKKYKRKTCVVCKKQKSKNKMEYIGRKWYCDECILAMRKVGDIFKTDEGKYRFIGEPPQVVKKDVAVADDWQVAEVVELSKSPKTAEILANREKQRVEQSERKVRDCDKAPVVRAKDKFKKVEIETTSFPYAKECLLCRKPMRDMKGYWKCDNCGGFTRSE